MTKKTKKTKKNTAAKAAVGKTKRTTSRRTSAPKPQSKAVAKAVSKTEKTKTSRLNPKNEFRFNHAQGHINYIFGESGEKYKSVGLTHQSETFGKKNMPLKKNPEKGNNSQAYIRNGIISDKKKYYGKPEKKYQFDDEDKKNVKSKIRHYKNEQRKKK